jgi:hypothetical protein
MKTNEIYREVFDSQVKGNDETASPATNDVKGGDNNG